MKTVYRLSPISVGILVNLFNFVIMSDIDYMKSVPKSITMLIDYEAKLSCQMAIKPDKYQWKFYPTDDPYNSKADINLSNTSFKLVPESRYTNEKQESILTILTKSPAVAGDYQCLAYYGAYVVASIPWRITIATLSDFPSQQTVEETISVHNTVAWHCKPPFGNPEPYIDYQKNGKYIQPYFTQPTIKSLILPNVSLEDSGIYTCTASSIGTQKISNAVLKLNVVRSTEGKKPYFLIQPQKTYTVIKGSTAFLECAAVGHPVPRVIWYKKNSQLPSVRTEMIPGGLKISNISAVDEGLYVCNFTNTYGMISHVINVTYNEEPSIECLLNNTDVKQGENLDLDCIVRGKPTPQVAWFLNGFSVTNDSAIETSGNKISFRPVEKRHAGNLQIFARNSIKTVYSKIDIKVIPLATSGDLMYTHAYTYQKNYKKSGTKRPSKHSKTPKMIPPNKPTISRLNDESVVVRWSVPENNGLPIQFFKVQYKEVGAANMNEHYKGNKGSRWKTTEKDIPPNIKDYDVTNLKTGHFYKFRVAAVYSNNDNKLSPMSKKFLLERLDFDEKNPLPTPRIIHTETVNSTSVKIYWECNIPPNITIDGFYISYMSASTAGDYMKATAEGNQTRSYTITHLTPETFYDIKIQSFNSTLASEFSSIMKAKTGVSPVPLSPSVTTATAPSSTANSEANNGFSKLYMMIAGGIVGLGLLVSAIVLLFVCRKWQQKKTADNRDKPAVEDHHIQADSNEYVVNPKAISRANGHVLPGNRITITSNPLAEADNKSQAMIEMRNFTAQNNNVRQENNMASGSHSSDTPEEPKPKKNEKTKRKNGEAAASGENYV